MRAGGTVCGGKRSSMIVIPAIDIKDGKCVRLVEGRESTATVFEGDPADWALRWVREGAKYLHVVDLDGAFHGAPRNLPKVKEIVERAGVPVEFGGGVRDSEVVMTLAGVGVARIILGSQVVDRFEWAEKMFRALPGRIAVGIDAVKGCVAVHGWTKMTNIDAFALARKCQRAGAAAVIYTDITRDGKMAGANLEAMCVMAESVTMPVIASGGVTTVEDLTNLKAAGCHGAIIGRALYDGKITLKAAIEAAAEKPAGQEGPESNASG